MSNWKNKLMTFMYGRYGVDALYRALNVLWIYRYPDGIRRSDSAGVVVPYLYDVSYDVAEHCPPTGRKRCVFEDVESDQGIFCPAVAACQGIPHGGIPQMSRLRGDASFAPPSRTAYGGVSPLRPPV